MYLTIHRGAHQIGGSCIEVAFKESAILLDVGLPLDHSWEDDADAALPQPLFQQIKEGTKHLDGVILSHAHIDHYGLAGALPPEIPVYCGEASAELIGLSGEIRLHKLPHLKLHPFRDRQAFTIGDFTVTPYLVDHSAFDAYAFLVSAGGKSLFYTGDFRAHGRKAKLFDRLKQYPPNVDALIMEGTLVGDRSDEEVVSEYELEEKLARIIEETPGMVLISAAGQNIDRLVTIFKATQRTSRMLIIDFYIAEILDRLRTHARLPHASDSFRKIRVCYPQRVARWFEKIGLGDVLERHRKRGIRWKRVNEIKEKAVMLIRPGFLEDLQNHLDLTGATWVYSMWLGYLDQSEGLKELRKYLEEKGVRIEYLHTSGHATISELRELAEAMNPATLIPIHTLNPEKFSEYFPNVRLVKDGEVVGIG